MRQLGYGEFVAQIITDIPYGQPFLTETIAKVMADRYVIPVQKAKVVTNVNLKRLMDKGQLERFQKGIYYRTKQTVFGKTRPTASAHYKTSCRSLNPTTGSLFFSMSVFSGAVHSLVGFFA